MMLLNDRIGAARFTTKTNTTMLDTFKAPEDGYIGAIAGGKTYFYSDVIRKHTTKSVFDISKVNALPQVDILYGYQNDSRLLYDALVAAGSKGIVVAGSGNGSLSGQAREGAIDAAKKGVAVVRSSRVGSGIVTRSASDDTNNFVASDSLNPQKARILLMLTIRRKFKNSLMNTKLFYERESLKLGFRDSFFLVIENQSQK